MTSPVWARRVAIAGAVLGWIGLGLEFWLLIGSEGGAIAALWRFLGYFTLLTNLWVALILTHAAVWPDRRTGLGGSLMVFSATTALLLVGIVYAVALRSLWNPEGLNAVADHIVHDAMPIFITAFWLLRSHTGINVRAAMWALVWPAAYFAYAMARGAIDGWYAYWFLNPAEQSVMELLVSLALLLAGITLMAQVLAGLDRLLAGSRPV